MTFLGMVAKVWAQTVEGNVTDREDVPVAYANIVLMNKLDSTFYAGTVSDVNGHFVLEAKTGKGYMLRLSSVGYKTAYAEVPEHGKMGKIRMEEDSRMLGDVVVKAVRPTTRLKGSSLITNVENSLLAQLGTAKDVLMKMPGVIDKNDKFEVFGKGEPVVYIDGRLMRDRSELERIGSENIKSVEVIMNPGARYDATVNAVIRIKTKRNGNSGFSANVSTKNGMGEYYYGSHRVDLNYSKDKLDLFAMVSVYDNKEKNAIDMEQEVYADQVWRTQWTRSSVFDYQNYTGKIGFMYQINEKHSFGGYYQGYYQDRNDQGRYDSQVFVDKKPYDNWNSTSSEHRKTGPEHQSNIYYIGQVGAWNIDLNADYMQLEDKTDQSQLEQSTNYEDQRVTTASKSNSRLIAEKLVLSRPVGKGTIDVGEEYTNSDFHSRFSNEEGLLENTDNRVKENNIAAFAELGQQWGKWNVSVGVRYEHVHFSYLVGGVKQDDQTKTYDNVFPTVSVSVPWGDTQWNLSYNSRTTRPEYSQLDGGVSYFNRYTYQGGNPYLKPSKRQNVNLSGTWKFLYFNASYVYEKDPVMTINEPYGGDPRILFITYGNLGVQQRLDVMAGADLAFGIYRPQLNVGVSKPWFENEYLGESMRFNKPMFMVSWNNSLELPYGIVLRADLNYQSKGSYGNAEMCSFWKLDASLYKSFLKDKLSLSLNCRDIFDTNHIEGYFYNANVWGHQTNHDESRFFSMTLQYKFNASKSKRYQGSGAGTTEKDRF